MERIPQGRAWGEPDSRKPLVLLVDDDIGLRSAMREFLANSGCEVLEARNSYDGLFQCAQYGPAIHLLITELNLLPVGGIKLAENALRLWPQMQVLCMAENAEARGVQYWMRYLSAEFLRKPFSPFELHEKVHALLGSRLEDAPMPVLDVDAAKPDALVQSSNTRDPNFWLKEF